MNKIKKLLLCCLSVVLILVSMCPISAYANSLAFFPCSEPAVTDYSGYVAVQNTGASFIVQYTCIPVEYLEGGVGSAPLFVVTGVDGWSIDFNIIGDPNTVYRFAFSILHSSGEIQGINSFDVHGSATSYFAFNSSYTITGLDFHGNWDYSWLAPSDGIDTFEYFFAQDKYDYVFLLSMVNALQGIYDQDTEQLEKIKQIYTSSTNIESILNQLLTAYSDDLAQIVADNKAILEAMKQQLLDNDEIIAKLNSLIDIHNKVLTELNNISKDVDDINYRLFEMFEQWNPLFWEFYGYLDAIWLSVDDVESKLDRIIELLSEEGESDLTKPDTSEMDGYIDAENSLLDNSNVNVSDVVQVEVNQNALTVIWELVEKVLNSHAKIFGAVLTVLSLGIVCMVLGRKV